MEIVLLRIDSRLLHGQVTTNWAKTTRANRIIIVSDSVFFDVNRKILIMQAAPPGIKVHVISIEKMLRVYKDDRFSKTKVLILVENPLDAFKLIKRGLKVDSVNIGSLSFNVNRKMLVDTVAVGKEDILAFKELHKRKIALEIRKVSSDSKKDLWKVLYERGFISK